jgi:(S)-mandelate dehydrogenase
MKAFNIEELRKQAKRRLPRAVFDFIDGGAEDELTLRGNREAFSKAKLLRKVLVDVSSVDTGTQILGAASKLPIAVAPTGALGFGWRGGDVAVAKAAARAASRSRFPRRPRRASSRWRRRRPGASGSRPISSRTASTPSACWSVRARPATTRSW